MRSLPTSVQRLRHFPQPSELPGEDTVKDLDVRNCQENKPVTLADYLKLTAKQ